MYNLPYKHSFFANSSNHPPCPNLLRRFQNAGGVLHILRQILKFVTELTLIIILTTINPMKKTIAAAMLASVSIVASAQNPMANRKAVVEDGNARFTVLTPEMIRIEYSPKGAFENNATFSVINRDLPVPKFKTADNGEFITITTDKLNLRYRKGTDPQTSPDNLTITMNLNGKPVVWHPGQDDPQNLKGTYRTLDGNNGDNFREKLENGLISRSGWAVINDSPSFERPDGSHSLAFSGQADGIDWVTPRADADALDLYFLGYGHDYKQALYDFTLIAGKTPLPPDYVFGYWYSKYDAYSADDFRNIAQSLADNDINTDVMILDMDWHYNGDPSVSPNGRGGWTGWSWNTNLIPDPKGLLDDMHGYGMKTALNLHPADGVDAHEDIYADFCQRFGVDASKGERIPWQLDNKDFYRAFFNSFIRPMEKTGVDFWWLDWQQYLTNPRIAGLGETFWCNHVFFNDMKLNRPDHRPVIFHRWGGLGSHRYQIGFSGDTFINYPTLRFQTYFTPTASNVGYGYWGHDLGGHQIGGHEANDPELVLRWIQYGVFTPIFRTHATKDGRIERRIWKYDNFPLMNEAVKLRYALFPYIYSMARKSYDTGIGLCRPLYYEYPEVEEAYARETEYFFGDDILVAPIYEAGVNGVSKKEVWFPEGNWWSPSLNRMFSGNTTTTIDFNQNQYPWFIREGGIIVNNPAEVKHVTERPSQLIVNFVSGADGQTSLYEDAGDSNNYDTEFATTTISQKQKGNKATYTIAPRKGSYAGMPASRAYTLNLYNTTAPTKVKLNGKEVKATYNATDRCTTVAVPSTPCNKEIKLTVEY